MLSFFFNVIIVALPQLLLSAITICDNGSQYRQFSFHCQLSPSDRIPGFVYHIDEPNDSPDSIAPA